MFQSGEEDPFADVRFEKQIFFLIGKLERALHQIDRSRRVTQEYLDGGVGDHRDAVGGIQEVRYVLRYRRDTEVIFASALRDAEEERRGVLRAHHPPRLVDDEKAFAEFFADRIPDVVRDDVHRDRLQVVLHVAHGEDDELFVHVHVRGAVHESRPCALGVFREACDQRVRPLHPRKHELKVRKERRLDLGEIRVRGDVLQGVGLGYRLVDDRVFLRREAAEHDTEKADKSNDVVAQDVARILILAWYSEVEGINVVLGGERYIEVASADGLGEVLVFAFGVDDDDLGVEHEATQYFQLRHVGFSCAGFCECYGIVVLEREAVEEDERRIVAVDAVENTSVGREVEGDEREDRRERRGIDFGVNFKLIGRQGQDGAESLLLLEKR